MTYESSQHSNEVSLTHSFRIGTWMQWRQFVQKRIHVLTFSQNCISTLFIFFLFTVLTVNGKELSTYGSDFYIGFLRQYLSGTIQIRVHTLRPPQYILVFHQKLVIVILEQHLQVIQLL